MHTTWTRRDGTQVPIKQMTNQHLINTIRLLYRNVIFLKAVRNIQEMNALPEDRPELFNDWERNRMSNIDHALIVEALKDDNVYFDLVIEAERRGIRWEYDESELQTLLMRREMFVIKTMLQDGKKEASSN